MGSYKPQADSINPESATSDVLAEISAGTAFGLEAELLTPDINVTMGTGRGRELVLSIAVDTRCKLDITFDGGTNWFRMNDDKDIKANSIYSFLIPATNTQDINFRLSKAVNIDHFLVYNHTIPRG